MPFTTYLHYKPTCTAHPPRSSSPTITQWRIHWIGGILLSVLFALFIAGCSTPPTSPPPTPIPPTRTVNPDLFPTLATLQPTGQPTQTRPVLDTKLYIHPNDLFQLIPPKGWAVEEGDHFAIFRDPNGKGRISIQAAITDQPLDDISFGRFVRGREANLFGSAENYSQRLWEINEKFGKATALKSLTINRSQKYIQTEYRREGNAIYVLDFWADRQVYEVYRQTYRIVLDHVTFGSQATSNVNNPGGELSTDIQPPRDVFLFESDFFEVVIPSTWIHDHRISMYATIDTFTSPDEHAFIQTAVYDDGEAIPESAVGSFILILLRNYYSEDVIVNSDKLLPGGKEQLNWHSWSGGYTGVTIFEKQNTTLLLFTVVYDDDYQPIYADYLEETIQAYVHP